MNIRTASCSCGQLRARVRGEPLRVSLCHCLACQQRTGSIFGVQASFRRDAVELSGAHKAWVRVGDEGTHIQFMFCPECGSTLCYTRAGREETLVIPVGAFADPHFPAPANSIYEEHRHGWVQLPPDIEHMA